LFAAFLAPLAGAENGSNGAEWRNFEYFRHALEEIELAGDEKIDVFRLCLIEIRQSRLFALFGSDPAKKSHESLTAIESIKFIGDELKRLQTLYREDPAAGGNVRKRHLIEIENLLNSVSAYEALHGVGGGYAEMIVRMAEAERTKVARKSLTELLDAIIEEMRPVVAISRIHGERDTVSQEELGTAGGREKVARVIRAAVSNEAIFWEVRGTRFMMVTVPTSDRGEMALPIVVRESDQPLEVALLNAKAIRLIKVSAP
jgi:hypothetical protein